MIQENYDFVVDKVNAKQYNVLQSGGNIMAFSIRLTDEERALAESYARLNSLSLAEAFKKALFEKIEDEYDFALAQQSYDEYISSGRKSRLAIDLWKELDL